MKVQKVNAIEEKIRNAIESHFSFEDGTLTRDVSLRETIGLSELDIVEAVALVEDECDLSIPTGHANKFKTFGDIVEYVEKHQVV